MLYNDKYKSSNIVLIYSWLLELMFEDFEREREKERKHYGNIDVQAITFIKILKLFIDNISYYIYIENSHTSRCYARFACFVVVCHYHRFSINNITLLDKIHAQSFVA